MEINLEYSLERLMLKLKLQYFLKTLLAIYTAPLNVGLSLIWLSHYLGEVLRRKF